MSKTTLIDDEKSKLEKKENPVQYYVKFSFNITYIFLLTTATITFIEAIRTSSPKVRHVLNLETAISVIAAYFYSNFVDKITVYEKEYKQIDWADITSTRYIDWAMTTPLMLLALCLVTSDNIGKRITLRVFSFVILFNFIMLYAGYLGEVDILSKWNALWIGFVAFFGLFGIIYKNFISPKYNLSNYVLFSVFVIVWALYGVFYLLNETYKNIGMNILDCISKCFIGLGLWAYFSKIIVL
jgi:bacteriorhodopsin